MKVGRKQDLSVIYWLKDLFNSKGIEILDGFPTEEFNIPCIAVEWHHIDTYQLEMGSKTLGWVRSWYLDVFAINKTQKDEIIFTLLEEIENDIDINDYDQGFPPSVEPSKIGKMKIVAAKANNIQVFPELPDKMYNRATINFVTQYETIGGI